MAPFDGDIADFSPALPAEIGIEDDVCRVLRRAASVIRERGWCQYKQEDAEGRVCAMGALYIAEHGESCGSPSRLTYAAARLLGGWENLVNWNNDLGRIASEVITALEDAANTRARALRNGV